MDTNKPIEKPIFYRNRRKIVWEKIYFREYSVQYSMMMLLSVSPWAKDIVPKPIKKHIIIPEGKGTALYADRDSWDKLSHSLYSTYATSTKELQSFEKKFLAAGKKYVRFTQKIHGTDFEKLTNTDILKIYLAYQKHLFTYTTFLASVFIMNNYVSSKATHLLDNYLTKRSLTEMQQSARNSLLYPEKRAAVLDLQSLIGKIPTSELYEKFKWLPCQDLHNKPWTYKEFSKAIKSYKTDKKTPPKAFSAYAHVLKISGRDYDFFRVAKKLVYLKDLRDDFRRQGIYNVLPFFAHVAERMNLHSEDMRYLQESDIISSLKDEKCVKKAVVLERKKGFMLYLGKNNTPIVADGTSLKEIMYELGVGKENTVSHSIRGLTASQGFATGKAVIIRGLKDLYKVRKGSILVAVTTHPDYTLAMGKAAAIVTDEGGLTCHAAIVARELHIPCIVGTHNATKILKDGDMVTVNADKGSIEKIRVKKSSQKV